MKGIVKDALERLDRAYPGRETLTRKEVAEFLGVSPDTVSRYIKHQKGGRYSKLQVAHYLTD